jgi:hypothetical protein
MFCIAYGEKFSGENHEDALSYAAFAVYYNKSMELGFWAKPVQLK